ISHEGKDLLMHSMNGGMRLAGRPHDTKDTQAEYSSMSIPGSKRAIGTRSPPGNSHPVKRPKPLFGNAPRLLSGKILWLHQRFGSAAGPFGVFPGYEMEIGEISRAIAVVG